LSRRNKSAGSLFKRYTNLESALTNEEAARQLGCPLGTVLSRLARARELLRGRLLRRGVSLSAGLLAATLTAKAKAAEISDSTIRAAVRAAAGDGSVKAVTLAKGAMRAMFMTRLKIALAVVAVLGIAGAGASAFAHRSSAERLPDVRSERARPATREADADAAKKELKKFEGTWVPVSVESNGKIGAEEDVKKVRYVFAADGKYKYLLDGNDVLEGTITIDPSKKPKTIDYKITRDDSGGGNKDKTSLGIYELDGDVLKVCRTWPENDKRPTEFAAPAGSKLILSEFKREKP
jgi:uncharacterized protein (TIGR03067 family)